MENLEHNKPIENAQKIKFVAQPYNSMQCGQACLSMITGQTIEDICKNLSKSWSTNIDTDIMPFLNRNGYKTRLIKGVDIDFDEVPNSSIIRIAYPNESGHFIIKTNNQYYDPSIGILTKILANRRITSYLTFTQKTQ